MDTGDSRQDMTSGSQEARWLREIRDTAADATATDVQAGRRIRMLLYPPHLPHGGGTTEGCPGCFPPGEAIRREIPRGAGDGCGHEPEGREIALAPGYEPGPGEYESWYPHLASGHKLSRDQIAQHGRDRYPSPAAQYAKILDEAGELGEALINWAGTEAPEYFARVRAEYADTGLALYALGDKLGLDLIECMAGLVAGDTRSFAEIPPAAAREGYDPVPDLAALIDGVRDLATASAVDGLGILGSMLTGPYTRLRGGLLLDEPGRENVTEEDALREALRELR